MSKPSKKETDEILENQDEEQIIEIDENGQIYEQGDAPKKSGVKNTAIADPLGEYQLKYF